MTVEFDDARSGDKALAIAGEAHGEVRQSLWLGSWFYELDGKTSENPAGTLAFLEKISQQFVHVKDIDVPSRMCLCNLIILLGI